MNETRTTRYDELLRYQQAIPLYDKVGRDTLWVSVIYSAQEHAEVRAGLLQIYAQMKGSKSAAGQIAAQKLQAK